MKEWTADPFDAPPGTVALVNGVECVSFDGRDYGTCSHCPMVSEQCIFAGVHCIEVHPRRGWMPVDTFGLLKLKGEIS